MADPLAGVELRHLIALRAVAATGSFGAAASSLGYTQSAISQQIAALEKAVGEKVIDRGNGRGSVTPTEIGAVLLRHADTMVATLDAARDDVAALRGTATTTLRVGAYQSVTSTFLPAVLQRVRATFPTLELEISEERADTEVERLILDGELDLGFTVVPVGHPQLAGIDLVADPWGLLLSVSNAPIQAPDDDTEFELGALDGVPLVGAFNCRGFQHAISHLRGLGIAPVIAQHAVDNALIRGLAAEGVGAALLPRLAYTPGPPLRIVDLDGRIPARRIGLAWRSDRPLSEPAQLLIDASREVCDGLAPSWQEPALHA